MLRYCARPPFALERLYAPGGIVSLTAPERRLVYRLPKPAPDGRTELVLSPLQLLERLARLIPPPRVHRHRYHGVLGHLELPHRPAHLARARPAPGRSSPRPDTGLRSQRGRAYPRSGPSLRPARRQAWPESLHEITPTAPMYMIIAPSPSVQARATIRPTRYPAAIEIDLVACWQDAAYDQELECRSAFP
ncbi:MAG: transposase [Gemmatimonadota bacterium]|nr:transposase [Gemmatimonadota bacterium]